MKIRMGTLYVGPAGCFSPGQIADLPEVEARALVDGGYAVAVLPPAQKAVVVADEQAVIAPQEIETSIRNRKRR